MILIAMEMTKKSKLIFQGNVLKVTLDTVELPDGTIASRELVHHPGGVCVVPVDSDGYVYMVKQYRKPYDEVVLEIPAGKRDKGEDTMLGAKRELSEETGLEADELSFIGEFYPTPGYTDEIIYMYLATDLKQGKAHPDEDEYVDVEKIHISVLTDMIMNNQIKDGKTIAAILKAKIILGM